MSCEASECKEIPELLLIKELHLKYTIEYNYSNYLK